MIKTILLDGNKSYFYDSESNEKILKYDPLNNNLKLHITLDDSELEVSRDKINKVYGGNIIVQYNDNMLFIDDGYLNKLIKAGYIVYKDYDNIKCINNKGIKIKEKIFRDINVTLSNIINSKEDIDKDFDIYIEDYQIEIHIYNKNGYDYTIRINDITSIVNKNLGRKDNSLTFYPFNKNMDKFGTMYISVFAEKKSLEKDKSASNKFIIPDGIIKELILNLGPDYHFNSLPVKGNVIFTEEL